MQQLGKLLQLFGMIILPIAILMELSGGLTRSGGGVIGFNVAQMLVMALFGVGAFYLGRILEGYSQ